MKEQKTCKIPAVNIRRASDYLQKKGVKTAYIFGSGRCKPNPRHDLDIAVDLPPTRQNKRKFDDATAHGIDLFLIDESESLFSVGCNDTLYTDEGDLQDLEAVEALKFKVKTKK